MLYPPYLSPRGGRFYNKFITVSFGNRVGLGWGVDGECTLPSCSLLA